MGAVQSRMSGTGCVSQVLLHCVFLLADTPFISHRNKSSVMSYAYSCPNCQVFAMFQVFVNSICCCFAIFS